MEPEKRRERVGNRKYDKKLPRDRDDQAVYTVAEGLENGAYNDAEAGEDETEADDAKRRDSDFQHMLRSIKNIEHRSGFELEHGKADCHDAHGDSYAQPYGLHNSLFLACSVVVGDDRYHTVVQAEYGHEDKALQFEVDAEDGGRCG